MPEWWPAVVFGWPAIIAAIGLSIVGIVRRKWLWPIVAAIIAIPYSYYLAGSPTYGWLALFQSPMLLVAGILVRYHRVPMAWLCLVPFCCVSGWLAIAVAGP